MQETFRHKGLRLKLIEEIRGKGIKDEKVLEAMNKIPRHAFMESGFVELAYKDKAFPIGAEQTISQPYTVAFQTQLLEVKSNEKILEVGTGSGYQTAILFAMGAKVYTIERQRELFLKAQNLLIKMGYHANFFFGDGNEGLPSYAPFDKILITAGATEIPKALLSQLRVGGRMVLPLGDSSSQLMTLVEKISEIEFKTTQFGSFNFVPLLKGTANSKDF